MSIDRYSSCPGGTGKKIKFCCSDLVSELDKVQRMLQGRQYASCLDLVARGGQKAGPRCLLACKLSLQQGMKDEEGTGATLRKFVSRHPDNAIAFAELAVDQVRRGELSIGLHNLQRTVGTSGSELPHQVFTAMGRMAEQFLHAGHMCPRRGLLLLQASINRADTGQAREMLARLTASPAVPLLFKDSIPFEPAPASEGWAGDFNSGLAVALALSGSKLPIYGTPSALRRAIRVSSGRIWPWFVAIWVTTAARLMRIDAMRSWRPANWKLLKPKPLRSY